MSEKKDWQQCGNSRVRLPSSQTLERLWRQSCDEVCILMHVRVAHGGICMALQHR